MYLRIGEWCECERSCDTSRGRLEAGISVYECEDAGQGKWQGKGAAFAKRKRHMGQQKKLGPGTWYLVTGERVGTGADKEPLLKKVTPHKIVVWDGSGFFIEKTVVQSIKYKHHQGFRECTCDSIDDILKVRKLGYIKTKKK